MSLNDPVVYYTLGMVAVVGVLILAAHQVDEAGHSRVGAVLLFLGLGGLIAAVVGPAGAVGMLLLFLLYAIFLGLPILTIVFIVRRLRRRTTRVPRSRA